jgi:hypothetical protein
LVLHFAGPAPEGIMTRTTITAHNDRHVTIKFRRLVTDQEIEMDIWAPIPREGGSIYVRYNGDKQLCDRLRPFGSTLTYACGTKLVDLVRREYRAMRAAEKRAMAPYA